jgi:hypothetical protein
MVRNIIGLLKILLLYDSLSEMDNIIKIFL